MRHLIDVFLFSDDPRSSCFGAIRDGVFDGQIHTKEGLYYVERIQKYKKEHLDTKDVPENRTVHSVIYHEKHMKDPYHHKKNGKRQYCIYIVEECILCVTFNSMTDR